MTAEGRLIQECCDDCTGTDDCDPCEAGGNCEGGVYTHGYWFSCEPETSTHGFDLEGVPYDCWDDRYTSAVWLYNMRCALAYQDSSQTLYGPHATEISAAGRMDWSTSMCAYESNNFVLRGVDSNGKRFIQNNNNDNYSLVNDSTAPTLTLSDGTVLYTIETMETYDYDGYYYYYFGETVFINTDDTTLIQNGVVDDPDGLWYGIPDWVFGLRNHQIITHPVKLSSTGAEVSVQSGWRSEALFCSTLNTYP